jgi:hypothetical protein
MKIEPILETLELKKISDQEYFSDKYKDYISNSRLGLINPEQDNDPQAFFEGIHSKYSDALIFGSAVHELVLQPDAFFLCESVNRPTAKAGFMADYLYDIYKGHIPSKEDIIKASDEINYYKGKMNQQRIDDLIDKCKMYWMKRNTFEHNYKGDKEPIYLDENSRTRVLSCIEALNNNSDIQDLLHPSGLLEDPISENEQAILLDIKVSDDNTDPIILKLKAKLDNYTIDKESNTVIVNDVKTIGKMVNEFQNNFNYFRYYRELAIYSWLLSLCVKKFYNLNDFTIKSNCLVVSTIPKYYTKIFKVTKHDFIKGFNEFKKLLELIVKEMVINGRKFS